MNPNITLLLFAAVTGLALAATWALSKADELLGRMVHWFKRTLQNWDREQALQRNLKARPASPAERRAMEQGAHEAFAAFARSESMFQAPKAR